MQGRGELVVIFFGDFANASVHLQYELCVAQLLYAVRCDMQGMCFARL